MSCAIPWARGAGLGLLALYTCVLPTHVACLCLGWGYVCGRIPASRDAYKFYAKVQTLCDGHGVVWCGVVCVVVTDGDGGTLIQIAINLANVVYLLFFFVTSSPVATEQLPLHLALDLPLLLTRAQHLIRNLLHLHILDPRGDLRLILVEDALDYLQDVIQFFLGEARASLVLVIRQHNVKGRGKDRVGGKQGSMEREKHTSSITNSSMTCVVGRRLYICRYSALFSRYFGASARKSECGPAYRVRGRAACVEASVDVV
jgi:hypothetical protein